MDTAKWFIPSQSTWPRLFIVQTYILFALYFKLDWVAKSKSDCFVPTEVTKNVDIAKISWNSLFCFIVTNSSVWMCSHSPPNRHRFPSADSLTRKTVYKVDSNACICKCNDQTHWPCIVHMLLWLHDTTRHKNNNENQCNPLFSRYFQ